MSPLRFRTTREFQTSRGAMVAVLTTRFRQTATYIGIVAGAYTTSNFKISVDVVLAARSQAHRN